MVLDESKRIPERPTASFKYRVLYKRYREIISGFRISGGSSRQAADVGRLPECEGLGLRSATSSRKIFCIFKTQEILGSPGKNLLMDTESFFI